MVAGVILQIQSLTLPELARYLIFTGTVCFGHSLSEVFHIVPVTEESHVSFSVLDFLQAATGR